MTYSAFQIWVLIVVIGIGTYLIRFSFLGLIGDRKLPEWLLRHLRYTPVAVIPGLVAPLVIWPAATDGNPDPVRSAAALMTLIVGMWTKNVLAAISAGGSVLIAGLIIFGV